MEQRGQLRIHIGKSHLLVIEAFLLLWCCFTSSGTDALKQENNSIICKTPCGEDCFVIQMLDVCLMFLAAATSLGSHSAASTPVDLTP